ncbi:MAG: hypothetical protein U0992_07835 [Planctomycetaceae bacterium]
MGEFPCLVLFLRRLVAALLVMVTMLAGLSVGTAAPAGAKLSAGCCCPPDCPLCDCTSCEDCAVAAQAGARRRKCDASSACTKACCAG